MYYILTRDNCSYCDKAKALLTSVNEDYESYTYMEHPMIVKLMQRASLTTVPQIWHNNTYVGGYGDLVEYIKLT